MERIDFMSMLPSATRSMQAVQKAVDAVSLNAELIELVKLRASQINGCAYCSDRHVKDSLAMSVDAHRLYLLPTWREADCYSSEERAALAWTEAVTVLSETGAPDADYESLLKFFNHEEIVALTWEVAIINTWNRMVVATRKPVDESY